MVQFKFKRQMVNDCVDGKTGLWCATKVDSNGKVLKWAYCPQTKAVVKKTKKATKAKQTTMAKQTIKAKQTKKAKSPAKNTKTKRPNIIGPLKKGLLGKHGYSKVKTLNANNILFRTANFSV